MDLDLLLDWTTTSMAFKVAVLGSVGAAYVLFEALLSRGESGRHGRESVAEEPGARALAQAEAFGRSAGR